MASETKTETKRLQGFVAMITSDLASSPNYIPEDITGVILNYSGHCQFQTLWSSLFERSVCFSDEINNKYSSNRIEHFETKKLKGAEIVWDLRLHLKMCARDQTPFVNVYPSSSLKTLHGIKEWTHASHTKHYHKVWFYRKNAPCLSMWFEQNLSNIIHIGGNWNIECSMDLEEIWMRIESFVTDIFWNVETNQILTMSIGCRSWRNVNFKQYDSFTDYLKDELYFKNQSDDSDVLAPPPRKKRKV